MQSKPPLVTVADIAANVPNAIAAGPFGSNLVSRDYVESGVPVIRGQNLAGRWVSGEFVYVSAAKAEQLRTNTARPGDIVFTQRGTLGQVSIVPEHTYPLYVVSQSQMKLTVDSQKADPRFVYYACTSADFVAQVHNNAVAAGVPHINLGILRGLRLPLPARGTQAEIAEVLSSLDDRIDLLRQTNTTLESIAQAMFKSWFIDFDPVRTKAEGREPEGMEAETAALFPDNLGAWHEQWQRVPVGKLASNGLLMVGDGYRAKNSELSSPGVSFVRAGDLLHGRITPTEDTLSLAILEKARGKMAHVGDTAFTSKGTIGRFAYVDGNAEAAVYSPQVCFWRSLNPHELQPAFLHFWMKSSLFSRQVDMVRGQAAIMDFVSLSDQRRMLLDLPSPALQQRFADLAEPILKRISSNREAARIFVSLRDALLPRLLSGKLRVTEAKVQLNEAIA